MIVCSIFSVILFFFFFCLLAHSVHQGLIAYRTGTAQRSCCCNLDCGCA
jgi:hypothetical protein